MNFQDLKKIESPDFYIDLAFRRATAAGDMARMGIMKKDLSKLDKSKNVELEKLAAIKQTLTEAFDKIGKNFPSLDDLPEFYKEMIRTTLDYEGLKKSLGAVNTAKKIVGDMFRTYGEKIKRCRDLKLVNGYRREFYGRISSIPKRIKNELFFLEHARKTMRNYPAIKTGIPTVAIAGFPNVGKSTLLSKLTTAKPEIKPYAFTTKGLNVGYMATKYDRVQFIDTPGTLNRFERMNYVEKIAYLTMKYAADKIVFVFDPVTDDYSFEEQERLFENTKNLHKELFIYISKTDIAEKEKVDAILKKYSGALTSIDAIKKLKFE